LENIHLFSTDAAISSIPLTAENYQVAVDKLKNRFSSNQVIISGHITALTRIQPVKDFDAEGLRRLLDESENRVMGLEVLGIDSSSYSTMIKPLLLERVPPRLSTKWFKKEKLDSTGGLVSSSVKDLFDLIQLEVESEERSKLLQQGVKRVADPDWEVKDIKKTKAIPSAAALVSTSSTSQSDGESRNCIYCQEQHSEIRCHVPLNKKMTILSQERRCYICLKKGHRAVNCRNANPECRECQRKHHTSICRKRDQRLNNLITDSESGLSGSVTQSP